MLTALVVLREVPKCFAFSLFTPTFAAATLKEKQLFLTSLLFPVSPHTNLLAAVKSCKNEQATGSNGCLWMSNTPLPQLNYFQNLVI